MKTKIFITLLAIICSLGFVTGCAVTDVTKTAKGHYDATNPNDVEILFTKPSKPYIELGSVSAAKFQAGQTATMHNAFREKAAALGANAVLILNSGFDGNGMLWATGVAIRYGQPQQ